MPDQYCIHTGRINALECSLTVLGTSHLRSLPDQGEEEGSGMEGKHHQPDPAAAGRVRGTNGVAEALECGRVFGYLVVWETNGLLAPSPQFPHVAQTHRSSEIT